MLKELYKMRNGFVLISPDKSDKRLSNGINVKETRGKRDIIHGIVEVAEESLKISDKAMCWFPMYAGVPITLEGQQYFIVDNHDIMMTERVK